MRIDPDTGYIQIKRRPLHTRIIKYYRVYRRVFGRWDAFKLALEIVFL